MLVYVINVNGQPLMPTNRCGKVRRLLKEKKAKVIFSWLKNLHKAIMIPFPEKVKEKTAWE